MSVRNTSDMGFVSASPKKSRSPIKNLEDLRGFEFLAEVSKFKNAQLAKFDETRVTFILGQLTECVKISPTRNAAIRTVIKVVEASIPKFSDHSETLCKLIIENRNKFTDAEIGEFANRLYKGGSPHFVLFKDFDQTYAKLYDLIIHENHVEVMFFLVAPLDLSSPQPHSFVLFDKACLYLEYAVLHAYLLQKPYLTHICLRNILHNKHLTAEQKFALIVGLDQSGVSIDTPDHTGDTLLSYAIKEKSVNVFNYLLPRVNITRTIRGECYMQIAILSDFVEGVEALHPVLGYLPTDFLFALEKGQLHCAMAIAKFLRHKWDNIPELPVKREPLNPTVLNNCKELIGKELQDVYRLVCKNPAIYSMEYLSEISDQIPAHYSILAKRVAHAWGYDKSLKDPRSGNPIRTGGNSGLRSLSSWISYLSKSNLPDAEVLLEVFTQVLHAASGDLAFKEVEDRLSDHEIVVALTGYNTHTTYAIFAKTVMLYANRGGDSIEPGVSIYDLPSTGITGIVKKLVDDKKLPKETYFSELKLQTDAGLSLIHNIPLAWQKGPFCTLDSLKAASLGVMLLKSMDKEDYLSDYEWDAAITYKEPAYKELTTEYRLDVKKGLLLEVDDFLSKKPVNKPEFASFYYLNLLIILYKLQTSSRWMGAEKIKHINQTKFYLNQLVDLL